MSKDLTQDMVTQAVEKVKGKYGRINLAEIQRELSISRQTARTLEKHDFRIVPHGNCGKRGSGKLAPYQQLIDKEYLTQGIT
ncbi:MAG: IS21 family transposase, partial [Candidatus Ornithospirochaeta sp.]